MFNNRVYREMPVVAQMLRIRAEQPQETFYSNYVDAVWFTRASRFHLPFVDDDAPDRLCRLAAWQPGYIIWFEPNEYKHYLAPRRSQNSQM